MQHRKTLLVLLCFSIVATLPNFLFSEVCAEGGENVERVVLAELFTASWCDDCRYGTYALNRLAEEYGYSNRLVVLQYHTNSSDPLGNGETEARRIWYNVQHFPVLVLDGREYVEAQENETYNVFKQNIDARLAMASDITLTLNGSVTDFGATIYVNQSVEDADYKLRFVVFEDDVPYTALNGEKVFRFVVRDVLDDEIVSLVKGQSIFVKRSFQPSGTWNTDKLGVAVFVQNDDTKEVLQADALLSLHGFSLFSAKAHETVDKGNMATFSALLKDTDNSGDKYDVAFNSSLPSDWKAEFYVEGVQHSSSTEVVLASGETKNLIAKVSTSQVVGRGNVTITAVSKSNPSLFESITLSVEAVEPRRLIVFDSLPRLASIKIDGKTAPFTQLPVPFLWQNGSTHTFSIVSPEVIGINNTRFIFRKWSDGDTNAERTIVVSSPAEYTAIYTTQFHLSVNSSYGNPKGMGWYEANTTATFSITTPMEHGNMTRHVFLSWGGALTSTSPENSIKMDKSKNVSAIWKTQYYLNVDTSVGDPKGGGWIDKGSEVQVSVTSPSGFLIQQVFVKWSGDSTAESPSITLRVDSPKVVTAVWRTDYTQLYLLGGGIFVAVVVILVIARMRVKNKNQ